MDGNGIYGHHVDGGVIPCDLDACGGRTGVTPDSNGERVYYYVVTSYAPFTLGCFGKKDHFTTTQECRALYPAECGGGASSIVSVTTDSGTDDYALYCPCFDTYGSNVEGSTAAPAYFTADEIAEQPANACTSFSTTTTEADTTPAPTASTTTTAMPNMPTPAPAPSPSTTTESVPTTTTAPSPSPVPTWTTEATSITTTSEAVPNSSDDMTMILGVSIGLVVLLLLAVALFFWWCRGRRALRENNDISSEASFGIGLAAY
eukprot:g5014.t1